VSGATNRRPWVWLSILLPAAVVGVQVWQRRWVSDDGFINVRVIHQLVAGNGPTYNLTERVEVGTSTLWLAFVTLGKLIAPAAAVGEVMVWLGTGFTVLAMLLLGLAAAHLLPPDSREVLPLGLAVLAGLPPFWDFGTSGLETSLTFCWLAGCLWALARRWTNLPRQPLAAWRPWPVAWLIGLGPLIRPDLALVALVFGVMLLCQSQAKVRGWLAAAGVALSTPVLYELFRMGYYASLVPNTALAKANASPAQGFSYLWDYVSTYYLYVPLGLAVLISVAGIARAAAERDGGLSALWIGPLLAAGIHAGFVVSVGGDFMHARFLLPATVLLAGPVALIGGAVWMRIAAVVSVVWALVAGLALRPQLWNGMIVDERTYYSKFVPDRPGAMVIAENWSADIGYQITQQAAKDLVAGRSYFLDITKPEQKLPTHDGEGIYVVINSLGIAGVGAGLQVTMVDPPSLGDPIGSRLVLPPDAEYRVGHAYKPVVWAKARYTAPDVQTDDKQLNDARAALACGDVPALIAAVSEPLTPQRFLNNIVLAPKLTLLRIPVDPAQARAKLCH
jgi:arabinofuranosyltransferase